MSEATEFFYLKELASWANVGWLVALLLGLWGVMLGIGKFGRSEILFLLCGSVVIAKLAHDWLKNRTKVRLVVNIVLFLAIIASEFFTMRWTDVLSAETVRQQQRLAQLDQIPKLQTQINNLTQNQSIESARATQELEDMRGDNKSLKQSIEEKDATLASIAKKQYELNFAPQIVVTVSTPTGDSGAIMNNGKASVVLSQLMENDVVQQIPKQNIAQGASAGIKLIDSAMKRIISSASLDPITNDVRLTEHLSAIIETQNRRFYKVPFSWTFIVKDGKIAGGFIADEPITETKPQ